MINYGYIEGTIAGDGKEIDRFSINNRFVHHISKITNELETTRTFYPLDVFSKRIGTIKELI